jgi:hypothetical protein
MTGYRGLPLVGRRSREARFDVRRGLPGWQGGRLALAETGMASDQDGCVGVRQTILIRAFQPAHMPWPGGSDTRD